MWTRKSWRWGLSLFVLFLLCFVDTSPTAAQSGRSIVVSGGIHALTVPWHPGPMTSHLNPAFMVGTDRTWKSGERWRLYYRVSLGFFRHHWWMTGVSVEPELGVSHSLPGGFHADLGLGLGYMHYFWRRESLELEDGRYVPATDWGKPSVIMPLSATLGYRGDSNRPLNVAPFVSARWGVQGLFLDEVPVLTHLQLLGGVRIGRGREPDSGRR